MQPLEQVYADYASTGLSLRGHPMQFCREHLKKLRVTTANELPTIANGKFVRVAGLVLLRQRPSTAKGITFVTLEDETGSMNLVIRPETWDRYYAICKTSNAWLVHGVLENRQNVIHVLVGRLDDLSSQVGGLRTDSVTSASALSTDRRGNHWLCRCDFQYSSPMRTLRNTSGASGTQFLLIY